MLRELCNPLPRLGAGLTSHKERLSVWWALRWLVPEGLNVMSGPLEQTKITRHVLLEVTRSLQKKKKNLRFTGHTGNLIVLNKLN